MPLLFPATLPEALVATCAIALLANAIAGFALARRLTRPKPPEPAMDQSALDDLTLQVQMNTEVEASAVTLIQGIAANIDRAITQNNVAQLLQLSAQLKSSANALATAIAANTVAAQTPAPAPSPAPSAPASPASPPAEPAPTPLTAHDEIADRPAPPAEPSPVVEVEKPAS